ncbi:MAG: NAD(P)H-hydrate epimerase [Thermoguttaceae bacterium]|nr:NAD(P)H-hydrate epimerase [Thermoguttaceae bacterium]MBQ9801196.1 NAD(P)H-hydrate epimerase [Thermoguttaceae bacterium]
MKTASCREVRELDARVVAEWKIPSLLLMENAGRGLAEVFLANAARLCGGVSPRRVLICCGKGNNGGDGFVLFRRLEMFGIDCRLLVVGTPESYRGDALTNLEIVCAATSRSPEKIFFFDGSSQAFDRLEVELAQADWAVDALLGTGAIGALRSPFDSVVGALNRSGKPVYAVDIPSGLNADDGTVATDAVRAKLTTTLAVAKPGLLLESAKRYVGELYVADIGVPVEPFLRREER